MTTETVEALLRKASQLQQAGRVVEAIEAYEQLLALQPDLPESWYNLGYLQRWAGRFEAALASYRQALDHGVSGPEEVHLNRGVIFADHLAQTEAAEAELKAALGLNPDYAPAWLNLGNLNEDRGNRELAREAYEHVLALEPDNALALTRLAGLTAITAPDDPIISRLRQAIAEPEATAADRADLGFALGQALDAARAYDEAFAAYGAANAASRASANPPVRYDAKGQEAFVDRLIRAFPAPSPRDTDAPSGAPIFICGLFRSGSTLTEQILASHSRITPGGELNLSAGPYPSGTPTLSRGGGKGAARKSSTASAAPIWSVSGRSIPARTSSPTNGPTISSTSASSRRCSRPPRSSTPAASRSTTSCRSTSSTSTTACRYALDLTDTAHWHGQYRRLMAHWKALYPDDIYDLDYETLVAEPRPTIERLLAFCGLDWEESCLSFHETGTAIRTASVWQVRQPIYRRSAGRWRNYERYLADVRAALDRGSDAT